MRREGLDREASLFVVDDDPAIRRALVRLGNAVGYGVEVFASAEEFLADLPPDVTAGCLLLDVALPGMSGPALHRELRARGWSLPVIFVTAHDDEATRGAIAESDAEATFMKPIEVANLLDLLEQIFARSGTVPAGSPTGVTEKPKA